MGSSITAPQSSTKLAILAGGGALPATVAEAAKRGGRDVHIVALQGEADKAIEAYRHSWVGWGQIGAMLRELSADGCSEMVIIGSVTRPELASLTIDIGFVRNLSRIARLVMQGGGDDTVLSNVVRFFEGHGFEVLGAHEIAPELVADHGPIGAHAPTPQDNDDIAQGFNIVRTMGQHDIGQAVVIARGHVLAVEAAEGTDAMLTRCQSLRKWKTPFSRKRLGVLIKCPKPGQEMRVDMPVIGTRTLELADEAGLAGIAVLAGNVMLADRADLIAAANARGMFVIGHSHDE